MVRVSVHGTCYAPCRGVSNSQLQTIAASSYFLLSFYLCDDIYHGDEEEEEEDGPVGRAIWLLVLYLNTSNKTIQGLNFGVRARCHETYNYHAEIRLHVNIVYIEPKHEAIVY